MRPAVAALFGALVLAAPASAAIPAVPMTLPGEASAASADTWIVGILPRAGAERLARAHGATPIAGRAWEVPRPRARALAVALERRDALAYAEPDRAARSTRAPAPDPLSPLAAWRDAVVDPELVPPPVTAASPLLALIDSPLDVRHPEFAGSGIGSLGSERVLDFHGTATAAIAAAPANGTGILGIWPGMRAVNLPLPARIRCSDSARQLARAIGARAAVVNMSYGASEPCYAEYEQVQRATQRGIALVAAAGNEFEAGNDPQFPASLPHVLTVAALDPALRSSFFSNANAAVDVAAPGEGVLTAVPPAEDPDDTPDGYAALDGTSFSAPMAAAALAWIRAARPSLTPDQATQVLRLSARDIDRRGYDPNTGFGLVQVGAALKRRPPIADPGEPNEDVAWVRGNLGAAGKTVYRGGRSTRTRGLLDSYEDPRDVYRIVIPARGSLRVTLKPVFGDADLTVHDSAARTVGSRARRLGASLRDGTRTDTVTVGNRRASARTAWVAVTIDDGARQLDTSYALSVTRR